MDNFGIKSQRTVDAEKALNKLDYEFEYTDLSLSIDQKLQIARTHYADVMSKDKNFTTGVVVNDKELHWRYCEQLCFMFFPGKYLAVD